MEAIALLLFTGLLIAFIRYRIWRGDGLIRADEDARKLQEGIELMQRRLYEEAFHYFDTIVCQKPRCAIAWAHRGQCQLMLGNYFHAITDCNQAISVDHDLDSTYLTKGIALYKLQQIRDAFVQFDKAIWYFSVHARPNAEAYRWRGISLFHLGEYTKAKKDFHRAIELGDEHAVYFLSMRGGNLDAVEINA